MAGGTQEGSGERVVASKAGFAFVSFPLGPLAARPPNRWQSLRVRQFLRPANRHQLLIAKHSALATRH